MITTLSVTSVKVLDQEEALDFYVPNNSELEKLPTSSGAVPLADRPRSRRHGRDLPGGARPACPR